MKHFLTFVLCKEKRSRRFRQIQFPKGILRLKFAKGILKLKFAKGILRLKFAKGRLRLKFAKYWFGVSV